MTTQSKPAEEFKSRSELVADIENQFEDIYGQIANWKDQKNALASLHHVFSGILQRLKKRLENEGL